MSSLGSVTPTLTPTTVATTTVAIDPTLLALLPITGVVLTIFAGLVGAAIQGKREHAKWVRERRYETYVVLSEYLYRNKTLVRDQQAIQAELEQIRAELDDSLTSLDNVSESAELEQVRARAEELRAQAEDLTSRFETIRAKLDENYELSFSPVTEVMILGPEFVRAAARIVIRTTTGDEETRSRAETVLDRAMRRALAITS